MRPLFWTPTKSAAAPWLRATSPSRISKSASTATLWEKLSPQKIDIQSFEALFSQKSKPKKKVMEDKTTDKSARGVKPYNALDGKRAQAVGILMGSLKVPSTLLRCAITARILFQPVSFRLFLGFAASLPSTFCQLSLLFCFYAHYFNQGPCTVHCAVNARAFRADH
jgi:hypothetical protein